MAKSFEERVALASGAAPKQEAEKSDERSQEDGTEESEESESDEESEDDSETEDDDGEDQEESEDDDDEKEKEAPNKKELDRRFGVLRQKSREIKKAEQESLKAIAREEARVTRLYEQARQEYGNPIAAAKAYAAGEYHKAAEYLQKVFGDDFSTITMNMAKGHSGVTKEQQEAIRERKRLEEEREALKREKQENQAKLLQEQSRARAVRELERKLKGHKFVTDEDDAEAVMKALEKTWDPEKKKFAKTAKQVADELLEKEEARLRKRGLLPPKSKSKGKDKGKPPTPPKTGTVSKTDARKLSFEERIARAKRMTSQLNRL